MKPVVVLLGIFLISFFSVCIAKQLNKEEYLKTINEERRFFAKKAEIPNMYKLEWDDFLATRAERRDCDLKYPSCRKALRDGNAEAERHAQSQLKSYFPYEKRSELIGDYGKYFMNGNEELTPGEKKIGCASVTTEQNKDKSVTGYGMFQFQTFCILEPEGNGESWNMPRGKAGSKCAEGYENDDGLCAKKSEESSGRGAMESSQNDTKSATRGKSYGVGLAVLPLIISSIL